MKTKKLILFGGSGSLGESIKSRFEKSNWDVWIVTRNSRFEGQSICWNPIDEFVLDEVRLKLSDAGPFDAVCWSQGMNLSDSVFEFNVESHREMYDVNVIYILNSLNFLLKNSLVCDPAKFCVLSSIWQTIAKQNKLSYSVTKSALRGLVLSAANDMAREGHLINAILPGVIDTPMTRENLSHSQISEVKNATQFGRLTSLEDVSNTILFLLF